MKRLGSRTENPWFLDLEHPPQTEITRKPTPTISNLDRFEHDDLLFFPKEAEAMSPFFRELFNVPWDLKETYRDTHRVTGNSFRNAKLMM